MPTLSELVSDRARVAAVYGAVTVQVEYAPGMVTEKALAAMMGIATQAPVVAALPASDAANGSAGLAAARDTYSEMLSFTDGLNKLLARLICWWDLTDNDAMYPLEPDRLAELPLPFRQAVLAAIFGDLRLGGTTASDSPPESPASSAPSKRTTSKKRG